MNLLKHRTQYLAYASWAFVIVAAIACMMGYLLMTAFSMTLYACIRMTLPVPRTNNSASEINWFARIGFACLVITLIQNLDYSVIESAILKMLDSIWMQLSIVLFAVGLISKDLLYLRNAPTEDVESYYNLKLAEQGGADQPATAPELESPDN